MRFQFALAERLHMTVAQLREQVSVSEYKLWEAHLHLNKEEIEAAHIEAASKAKNGRG